MFFVFKLVQFGFDKSIKIRVLSFKIGDFFNECIMDLFMNAFVFYVNKTKKNP